LLQPRSVAVGPDGSFYIADTDSSVVRKVSPDGSFSQVIAGNGITGQIQIAGEIGQAATMQVGTVATETSLAQPAGVAVAGDGTVYIADKGSHVVVKVTPDGIMYVVAGTGTNGFQSVAGGGTTEGKIATQEQLNYPSGVAVGPKGNIFIADTDNNRIRKVTPDGLIYTVAGIGTASFSGDGGPATGAELDHPTDTAVDPNGVILIADRGNARIRKVDANGIITTVAGTGASGFGGDGGPATSALLNNPESVSNPDANGTFYIADRDNHRVRRVTSDGKISTVAGTGSAGEGGQFGRSASPANSAQLRAPRGVSVAPNGTLFIADTDNGQVRKVTFS
jgi:glucose/arabinose dehydrogenase